jgi:hypothetical protein
MIESLMDALIDTGKLVPLLAVVYFVVAFLEYRYGNRMGHLMASFGQFGPVAGALFGCIPQCGFSVLASALYVKRLISVGTLLAVFISTSDEAVPVLLSMPGQADMVGHLVVIKVLIAVIVGVGVDLVLKGRFAVKKEDAASVEIQRCDAGSGHAGCCSHGISDTRSKARSLFLHPLMHTVKIFFFLFILSFLINVIVGNIGEERIGAVLLTGTLFQPVLATFIGFIPNCFASVLLAQFYVKGVISFGALVSGLSAGAGLGVLVLAKENKNIKDTFMVIGILLAVSMFSGMMIQLAGRF